MDEYNIWENSLSLLQSKYPYGYQKLSTEVSDMENNKPETPHTSLSHLQTNLNNIKKELSSCKKRNTNKINNDLESNLAKSKSLLQNIINNLESSNQQYINILGNQPHKPHKYFDIDTYNTELEIFTKNKNSLISTSNTLSLEINHVSDQIQSLDKLLTSLQTLSTQHDEYKSIISYFDDHPYNPDCWACKKQPWKLRHDSIMNKSKELDSSIKEHTFKIKDIVGSVPAKTYLKKLRKHHESLLKYNIMKKELDDFWISEKQRIIDLHGKLNLTICLKLLLNLKMIFLQSQNRFRIFKKILITSQ